MKTESGISIYVEGSGEPILVIGGGPGISSRIYRSSLKQLATLNTCYFWDVRGTGDSLRAGPFGFERDYLDLQSVIEKAALGASPFSIFAHSYGGLLGLHHAIHNPKSLKRLILVGTSAALGVAAADGMVRKSENLGPEPFRRQVQLLMDAKRGILRAEEARELYAIEGLNQLYKPPKEILDGFARDVEISFDVLFANTEWATADYTAKLGGIEANTLVVCGAKDIIVPQEFSVSLAKGIRNSTSAVIDNCGHWPFIERPDTFWRELSRFQFEGGA